MAPLPNQTNFLDQIDPNPRHARHRDQPARPEVITARDPSVTVDEQPRLSAQCQQMLDRLRYGPATNRDLAEIGLKYTGRISDLRAAGYRIVVTSKCVETGRCIYELKEGGE